MRLAPLPALDWAWGYLSGLGTAGVGRRTGRLLSLLLVVRVFVFTLERGAAFTLTFAFGFDRLTFVFVLPARLAFVFVLAGRLALALTLAGGRFEFVVDRFAFVLVLALPFSFAFSLVFFGFGFLGLFSFSLPDAFVLRFSLGSSAGVTVSGDSPALAGRLISIATV
jgi:hypothetical protein